MNTEVKGLSKKVQKRVVREVMSFISFDHWENYYNLYLTTNLDSLNVAQVKRKHKDLLDSLLVSHNRKFCGVYILEYAGVGKIVHYHHIVHFGRYLGKNAMEKFNADLRKRWFRKFPSEEEDRDTALCKNQKFFSRFNDEKHLKRQANYYAKIDAKHDGKQKIPLAGTDPTRAFGIFNKKRIELMQNLKVLYVENY